MRRGIQRREVIEFYARYDCAKKTRPAPQLESWKWNSAGVIDGQLKDAGLKFGILGGYLLWDLIALWLDDLRACAVQRGILPSQVLSEAEESGVLATWQPDRSNRWLDELQQGEPLVESAALILRPAVASEQPARWYVEDGSGRALGIVSNARAFDRAHPVAFAYVGRVPDPDSTFMKERFPELLRDH